MVDSKICCTFASSFKTDSNMKSLKINTGATRNEVDRTDHIKNFIRTLYDGKPLSKEKENELFREYILTKNDMIKDTIIKSNCRFVYSAAKAFTSNPEEVLELTMEGCMGLLEAFDRFDPETGNGFLSFANHYVYKYMVDYTHKSKFVKRSKDLSLKSKAQRIKEKFFAENGRYPDNYETIELIKERYGIDVKEEDYVSDIIISRLDDAYVFGNGETANMLESPDFTKRDGGFMKNEFVVDMEKDDIKNNVEKILSVLSVRDAEIMKKLFGINCYREYTPEELADEYEMTIARINQIRKECLSRMKKYKFAV